MSRNTATIVLVAVGLVFAVIGVLVHLTLRILAFDMAADGQDKFQSGFAASFTKLMHSEHPRIRTNVATLPTREAANKAFEEGKADIIVARSDSAPRNGLGIAVVRRDLMLFMSPHWHRADSIGGLGGSRIAILGSDQRDGALLQIILNAYGVKASTVSYVEPGDLGAIIHARKADTVFVVAPATSSRIAQTWQTIRKASEETPRILMIDEADAISKRNPTLESQDVPKGAIIGNPAAPDDDSSTLSVSSRLMAPESMPNAVVGEIARMLFKDKGRIASELPATTEIEAPDTDTLNAALPLHPGAYNYLTGNQPSISDQAQDAVYWVGLVASGLGSLGAIAIALMRRFRTPPLQSDMHRLLDIWGASAEADSATLRDFEQEVGRIVHDALRRQADGSDPGLEQSFSLVVAQVRLSIKRRRRELNADTRPAETARIA